MVKHLVMWKLQPGWGREERAAALKAEANRLLAPIAGVQKLEIWQGYLSQETDHELALYIEFDDRQAESAYQSHPSHIKFKEFVRAFVRDRAAIDTEL